MLKLVFRKLCVKITRVVAEGCDNRDVKKPNPEEGSGFYIRCESTNGSVGVGAFVDHCLGHAAPGFFGVERIDFREPLHAHEHHLQFISFGEAPKEMN